MLRDFEFVTRKRLHKSIDLFKNHNIPAKLLSIKPVIFSARTCSQRIPSVTLKTSSFIYRALLKHHILSSHNYLKHNPRHYDQWDSIFFNSSPDLNLDEDVRRNFEENRIPLMKFFRVAYGEHETSYERSFEAFQWLLNICKIPISIKYENILSKDMTKLR